MLGCCSCLTKIIFKPITRHLIMETALAEDRTGQVIESYPSFLFVLLHPFLFLRVSFVSTVSFIDKAHTRTWPVHHKKRSLLHKKQKSVGLYLDPSTMAIPPFLVHFSECFQTAKKEETKEEEQKAYQRYKNLISTLPQEQGWRVASLIKYEGFWIPEFFILGAMAFRDYFHPRPSDFIVASHPKSGFTWHKALSFATLYRGNNYPPSAHHPLLQRHTHDCVALLEELFGLEMMPDLDVIPSPRLLSTHTPYSLLPDSVKNTEDCKIVYVGRDPKDALVSLWYFIEGMRVAPSEPLPLEKAFELFCAGATPLGPIWDHQLEYWQESLRRPWKVLFLKYEDMKAEPVKGLKRLAGFMGCPFSEEEEKEGVVEEILRLCSFEKLSNLDVNKKAVRRENEGKILVTNNLFFRKGEVGDWKNILTPEMARRLDEISQEKFDGSGLSFPRANFEHVSRELAPPSPSPASKEVGGMN